MSVTGKGARDKGARAEREIAALFSDELGITIKRRYNLGTHEDVGDVIVPNLTVQVANYANVTTAVRQKPLECEQQQTRAGTDFGVTAVRLRGGDWRWVMTTQQFLALYRETL